MTLEISTSAPCPKSRQFQDLCIFQPSSFIDAYLFSFVVLVSRLDIYRHIFYLVIRSVNNLRLARYQSSLKLSTSLNTAMAEIILRSRANKMSGGEIKDTNEKPRLNVWVMAAL